MKNKLLVAILMTALLCLITTGCSSSPKYTVSITENRSATIETDLTYPACSNCSFTAAEIYTKDGKEYVKATQTLNVTKAQEGSGESLTWYTATAYQNGASIKSVNTEVGANYDDRWQKALAGGSASCDYYYPVGDYSDITINYGSDLNTGHTVYTVGKTVIHFEKK